MATIEDALSGLGPWHYSIILFCFLRGLPSAYHAMAPTFMAPALDHWCAKPPLLANWTEDLWRSRGIPLAYTGNTEDTDTRSKCEMYAVEELNGFVLVRNTTTLRCAEWEYDLGENVHTLTNQFDLVCERVWLRAASQSFYMAGQMIGSFLYAHISDWYGRKRGLMFMLPMPLVVGSLTAFSNSFLLYNVGRMLTSFGLGGMYNTAYTLMIECVSAKYRAIGTFLLSGGWTCGLLVLVALAWFIRDWFYLQLTISLAVLFNVFVWFFLYESPRWLLATGRLEEAKEVLDSAIKRNRITNCTAEGIVKEYGKKSTKKHCPYVRLQLQNEDGAKHVDDDGNGKVSFEDTKDVERKPTFLDLFRWTCVRKTSVIVSVMAVCNTLEYYNLTYSSILLGNNAYLSFALVALTEYPSCIVSIFLIRCLRRRTAYAIVYAMAAVCAGASIFIRKDPWWLELMLAVFAKLGTSCGAAVTMTQLSELYPTRIRTVATGFYITMSRVGAIIAPFTKELGVTIDRWVPRAVDLGACGLLVFSGLSLPETFNQELPDTIEDIKWRK